MPDPSPLSAFEHVYAEPHPVIDAERDAYASYLDSFDDAGHGVPPSPGGPPGEPSVAQARGTGGFGRSGEVQ